MRYLTTLLAFCSLVLFSCDKTLSPEEQLQEDIEKIKEYLTDNNLAAQSTASGLHYIITQEGSGGHPNLQATVKVKYKGYLLDGTVFDQTTGGQILSYPLGDLIKGWQEGIPLLKRAAKGPFGYPPRSLTGRKARGLSRPIRC